MSKKHSNTAPYVYAVIGLISCSMLMYEILLTRVCALRLHFHFGFLVVSNGLLGIGASGSLIYVLQEAWAKKVRSWIWALSSLFVVSLVVTYTFLLTFDIEPGINFRAAEDVIRFSIFNLVATVPFFFAGAVIGLMLTANAEDVNRVYFTDLVGASIGCLLCPLLLWKTGAGGCMVFLTLLAVAGAVISTPTTHRRLALAVGAGLALIALIVLPTVDRRFPVPSKEEVGVTETVEIDLKNVDRYSQWSATGRIDLIPLTEEQKFVFGLGSEPEEPLPEEKYILQDGSAGTYILNFSGEPEGLEVLRKSVYSAAAQLLVRPRVLIIGVGGGNDVWAAKLHDASSIKGVELNRQILDIHRRVLPHYSKDILEDPRITLVNAEGRSALLREDAEYDLIQMTGIDTWTSLTSGAYMLAENYLYTVEAFKSMLDRLAPGGIIQITRFASTPEILRLLSNTNAAFATRGIEDIARSVFCMQTGDLITMLVKPDGFTASELDHLNRFASIPGREVVYHPARTLDNLAEEFVRSKDKSQFIDNFQWDISPTPDDRPYFFSYMRWSRLGAAGKFLTAPPSVTQGNPLFILGQLGLSALLAIGFILLPVTVSRRRGLQGPHIPQFLVYFAGLGLGFIAIEIALMQKLVLFLGHPLYSITVTLFAMLCLSGIGSLLSARWFSDPTRLAWIVPCALSVLLVSFMILSPLMVETFVVFSTSGRVLLTILVLAPISLLLGMPFAFGVRLLNRYNPAIIPWAWAVNACFTVVGSVLTVVLSMNFGFNVVLMTAVLIYFSAFFSVRRLLG